MIERWRDGVALVDAWLFAPEAAGRVRAMRLLLALLIALRLATGPHRGLAGQPAVLFRPVWFLRWLDQMPSAEVLVAIQLLGIVAAVLAVLGWRERGTFLVAWSSLFVLAGLRASRGKVLHNDLPLLLVAGVIVLAPVGMKLLDERRSPAWGWPVRTSLVIVSGVYVLSGLQKLLSSGPAWVLSDNLRNVLYGARLTGHAPTDSVALFIADRPWLAHVAAFAALAIELGGCIILIRPRARVAYLVAVTGLHASIFLTHGLDYSMWVGTAAIVLIDWHAVARRLVARRAASPAVA